MFPLPLWAKSSTIITQGLIALLGSTFAVGHSWYLDPEWWIYAVMDLIPLLLWGTSLGIDLLLQFKWCSHYLDLRSFVAVFEKSSTLHAGFVVWTEHLSIFVRFAAEVHCLQELQEFEESKCLSHVGKSGLMVQNSCQCFFNLRKSYAIILKFSGNPQTDVLHSVLWTRHRITHPVFIIRSALSVVLQNFADVWTFL